MNFPKLSNGEEWRGVGIGVGVGKEWRGTPSPSFAVYRSKMQASAFVLKPNMIPSVERDMQQVMRNISSLVLSLALASCAAVVGAAGQQPTAAEAQREHALSLREALDLAVKHRPELKAAASAIQSAVEQRKQAGVIPNPRLFYQSENLRPGMDFTQDVDTFAYASELLEISGRRGARIGLANSTVARSRLLAEQRRREILFRTAQSYWDALRAQFQRQLSEQSEGYYREMLDYHGKRFNEGKIAGVDLLRVRLEDARAEAAMETSRLAEAQAKQRLAYELGVPEAADWRLTESFADLNTPPEDSAEATALRQRSDVQLAQQAVIAARAQLLSQKAQGRPDLETLFGYKRTSGQDTMIAGLQLNLPLFDRNQGAVGAARAEVESSQQLLSATEQSAQSDLKLARMAYTTWKRQVVERYGPLREQAEEVAEISRGAFREGGMDLLHLLDAERLRVEAQSSWIDALANYHQSVLNLEYAQGQEP